MLRRTAAVDSETTQIRLRRCLRSRTIRTDAILDLDDHRRTPDNCSLQYLPKCCFYLLVQSSGSYSKPISFESGGNEFAWHSLLMQYGRPALSLDASEYPRRLQCPPHWSRLLALTANSHIRDTCTAGPSATALSRFLRAASGQTSVVAHFPRTEARGPRTPIGKRARA